MDSGYAPTSGAGLSGPGLSAAYHQLQASVVLRSGAIALVDLRLTTLKNPRRPFHKHACAEL